MKRLFQLAAVFALCAFGVAMQSQDTPVAESRRDMRYQLAVIEDATRLNALTVPIPRFQNRVLLEPSFAIRFRPHWSLATSVIGIANTNGETHIQLRVKEAYAALSAGDFDFTAGRRMVRWGAGYAFTATGVLDPPRNPTDPGDRLNLNQGRDMVKADLVRGPHAFTLVWASAVLAGKHSSMHDTVAFRYNVLVHGFDTSLIAGNDRSSDSFGGLTLTRVFGEAWEVHAEAAWRAQGAVLLGAKYTMPSGVTFIGEFFTPPNTAYYRSMSLSPLAGRQHYGFIRASKSRLRELPGWKEWDLSGAFIGNLNDRSYTAVFDAERRFGNRFSSYLHAELPVGKSTSEYGAAPYHSSTSVGVRFQL